ncbi:structural protein [Escherichia phage OLB145]|uniref:Structural protein n=1 Tax=Escherichia phage OLB145 TaxID=2448910 RepID=A0A3G3MD65_9CAUD|nr:structural protein [Escherichia phage OLB145]
MSCGAELEANALLTALVAGEDFTLPDIDMSGSEYDIPGGINSPIYAEIEKITTEQLTTREVGGSGVFDALMQSASNHLLAEFKNNRITGGDYVKAYIATMEACMANAMQFLTTKDQAYWNAVTAQVAAITARANLGIIKANFVTAKIQALATKAEYALTKLKLSNESVTYCTAQYNLSSMLPQQLLMLKNQTTQVAEQTKLTTEQINMTKEQKEAQRAQTSDTRTDGTRVAGSVGKQKELYDQQITSYKRDAEVKAAKLFTDAWVTQKTIDEGLSPPNGFTNSSLDRILTALKNNNALG